MVCKGNRSVIVFIFHEALEDSAVFTVILKCHNGCRTGKIYLRKKQIYQNCLIMFPRLFFICPIHLKMQPLQLLHCSKIEMNYP